MGRQPVPGLKRVLGAKPIFDELKADPTRASTSAVLDEARVSELKTSTLG